MEKKIIKLWPEDETVTLIAMENDKADGPALLVLPGGGYNLCAPAEGEPVAEHFAALGYRAYVLRYSTRFGTFDGAGKEANPHTLFPEPLREVAAAVAHIRACHGDIPVVVLGFSAGGHLASCYSNLWNRPDVSDGIGTPAQLKPDVCLLGYAATELTQDEIIMKAIYGEKEQYSDEELHRYMARELIGPQTPPTFLFHSLTDPRVPACESLNYAQALAAQGVAHEVHMFGCGGHAYALGKGEPTEQWTALADRFVRHVLAQPQAYDKAEVARAEAMRFRPRKA